MIRCDENWVTDGNDAYTSYEGKFSMLHIIGQTKTR